MPTLYRIKDWSEHFENAESRKVKNPRWVAIPNKHDGKGFGRIRKHPDAIPAFCGWCLIVQIASKMPERGILADEDGPLTAEDMADATGFPVEIFEIAIKLCSDKKIGWIEAVQSPDVIPEVPGTPGGSGPGREGKGIEENRSARAGGRNEVEEAFDAEGITLPGVSIVDTAKPVELPPNPLARADVASIVKQLGLAERLNTKSRAKLAAMLDSFGVEPVVEALRAANEAGATLPVGWADARLNSVAGADSAKARREQDRAQKAAMPRVHRPDGAAKPLTPPPVLTLQPKKARPA